MIYAANQVELIGIEVAEGLAIRFIKDMELYRKSPSILEVPC